MSKVLFRSLLATAAAAAAFSSTPAAAQRIDRIVAFGDSYADTGNLFELLGITPPVPYLTGRFSGGTNYIDTLSNELHVPVENFAIGGALTNNTNTNSPLLPGFTYETVSFASGGGGVFPIVDGTFDQHDLVTVSVGGNDARTYQTGNVGLGVLPGTLAGAPAAAAVSAAAAAANLDVLVDAGAPTISFLALNTALAPEVQAMPDPAGAAAIRSAFSTTFNAAIQQTLSGYAANGVTVHYLDLSLIGARIAADPAAYGLQNAGPCPLADATRCVSDTSFVNQYLFYVDGLHLTSAGFAIVAHYVETQLAAPLTLQAPSDLGLDTAREFGRVLSSRVDLYGPQAAAPVNGLRFFVVGDDFTRDVPNTDATSTFTIRGIGATAGVEYGMPNGIVGLAGNYSRPKAHFGNQASRDDGHSWQIGGYAGLGTANLFAQAYLGYGQDKHRITRTGVIDDMSARPDGSHTLGGVKAGYLMPMAQVRVGPIVALDYARAKVDGYTEAGDAALTLNVGEQKLSAFTGQLGLEAHADLAAGGLAVRPFITAAVEHDFKGDSRTILYAQTSAPVIVNSWTIDGRKQTYGRLSGGLSAQLFDNASLDVAASSSIGRDNGEEFGGQVGLKLGF